MKGPLHPALHPRPLLKVMLGRLFKSKGVRDEDRPVSLAVQDCGVPIVMAQDACGKFDPLESRGPDERVMPKTDGTFENRLIDPEIEPLGVEPIS